MAIPVHNPAEPIALYDQEIQTYLNYSIPGSTIFWAEGLPLDASPHEFPMDHAASLQHIQRQLQQGTPTVRLPLGLFGTCLIMAPEAAQFHHGFHHGLHSRLALRIIPVFYKRSYA